MSTLFNSTMLPPIWIGLLSFLLQLFFCVNINPLESCFYLLKIGLCNFLYCLELLYQNCSLDFLLVYQIEHCFLIWHFVFWLFCLPFLLALPFLYWAWYKVFRMLIVWILILYEFHLILIPALNKVWSFYNLVCIFFIV